jgi:transglutaminase-like putative cysteine protease
MERSGDPLATQQQPRSTLVAVGVLSGASTLCLARVFSEWGWLVPCLLAATVSVAVGAAVDRWGRRTLLTFVALVLGGAIAGMEATEPGSTFVGIPTPTSIGDLGHDLGQMLDTLHRAAVPVPPVGPALLLAVLAAWATGAVSYACATRLSGSLAPLVAPLTVFVTVSALGRGSHAPTTAAFAAGVAVFLLAQHRSTLVDRRARFHSGPSRGAVPLTGAVAAIVVAIIAALVAGPTLPGARSNPLLDYRRLGGSGAGQNRLVVVTPLVDIRDRLKEHPTQELFTVQSDYPAYWRIAGLDEFDGQVWGIAETESLPASALASNAPLTGTTVDNEARFTVSSLGGPWIPVSYRPTSINLPGARVLPGSDTVIRDGDINASYTVKSVDPAPTPFEMAAARVQTGSAARADLELPGNFPDRVRALAHSITDRAATPYAKALLLQNYLRDGYDYSLTVPKGHSDQALVEFLFTTKAGFCEQFSSAFAAMARSIGLPTRVAVGFTTGDADSSGTYHVKNDNAHAWPEVAFAGLGWIRFEPTPGRFDPTENDPTTTGRERPSTPTSTTVPKSGATPTTTNRSPAQTPKVPKDLERLRTGGGTAPAKQSPASRVLHFLIVVAVLTFGALFAFAFAVVGLKALRRWRRRHASTDRARVVGAWDEAIERLAEARIHRRPSSTPVEFAMREAPASGAGDAGPPLLSLAHLATTALWAPDDPTVEEADDAWKSVKALEVALRRNAAPRARVRRRLDPRVLRSRLPGDLDPGDESTADDGLVVVTV